MLSTEEAQRKKEEEAEERKKQSHDMVADSIRRELAESTYSHSSSFSIFVLISINSPRGEGRRGP